MKLNILIAVIVIAFSGQAQKNNIVLNINNLTPADSISVKVWDHFFSEHKRMVTKHRSFEQFSNSGSFTFTIGKVEAPVYFSLNTAKKGFNKYREILKLYVAEPCDSIALQIGDKGQLNFTGKGANKYTLQYRLDTLSDFMNNHFLKDHKKYDDFQKKNFLNYEQKIFSQADTLLSEQLSLLESYRSLVSSSVYQLLKADLIGKSIEDKFACYALAERTIKTNNLVINDQRNSGILYSKLLESVPPGLPPIPDSILALSKNYTKSQVQLTIASQRQRGGSSVETKLRESFCGILKDKLLSVYMIENFDFLPSADSLLSKAIQNIETPYVKEPLITLQNRLSRGAPAYDFLLEDSKGKFRSLSEFKGKTVFLDFWYTGCAGCVQLYRNALAEIEHNMAGDSSITFITISIDADKEIWQNSIKGGTYTSEKAINLTTGILGMNHPVMNRFGVSYFPTTFLIDKYGNIIRNTSSLRDKKEIFSLLQESK